MTWHETRIAIANFLDINLIDNKFIFINVWSFVHFFAGMLIAYLIVAGNIVKKRYALLFLFFVLIIYEGFEWIFIHSSSSLFLQETLADSVWDVILGMFGGAIALYFMKK